MFVKPILVFFIVIGSIQVVFGGGISLYGMGSRKNVPNHLLFPQSSFGDNYQDYWRLTPIQKFNVDSGSNLLRRGVAQKNIGSSQVRQQNTIDSVQLLNFQVD
jgi:hypothetical protein